MSKIQEFTQYLKEVKIETKKVTFISKKDTMQTTWVVLAVVVFMGVYLGLADFLLSWGLGMVLS